MRISLITGLLIGLLAGFLVSGQVATSQEEPFPPTTAEERGRFQIAGHSTYPPLLVDSATGTAWILMSTSDGEERRWVWEPIDIAILEPSPSPSTGRDIARMQAPHQPSQRKIVAAKIRSFTW